MARTPTVFTAARKSRLEGLEALRDRLSRAIDECTATKDLPPLASRHMEVTSQIEELKESAAEKAAEVSAPMTARDEISARRAARATARKAS